MEDENGGLSILENVFPTIRWNIKEDNDYEGQIMGGYLQKGIGNNMVVLGNIDGFQHLKRKDNEISDEGIS
jgi:hypothetical protein